MRKMTRTALTPRTTKSLSRSTQKVLAAADPKADADARWKRKPKAAFAEVRRSLEQMATGRSRCMYCEDSMGTDIDHFWPKSNFPAKAFTWENYLLACSFCNSNQKRTLFPLDTNGNPLLLDPTAEDPELHLNLLPATGDFAHTTPKGDESIKVFGLNDSTFPRRLPKGRKDALIALTVLLKEYDSQFTTNPAYAQDIKSTIKDFPFSVVLSYLVKTSQSPNGAAILSQQIVNIVARHNITTWL